VTNFFDRIRRAFKGPAIVTSTIESDIKTCLTAIDELRNSGELLVIAEKRSRTLEHLLQQTDERITAIESLLRVVEERTRTLEYVSNQSLYAHNHQIDFLQKFYVELMPRIAGFTEKPAFNATAVLYLNTDYPIAVASNDHVNPDSTAEGLTRPTLFVQDCIKVLGSDIRSLDLGTGAAGLVFEFAMSDVLAVGIDGSDFCRKHRVGYWPLLGKNLFTCDITKPFEFVSNQTADAIEFEVITMWEVLEHLSESDFPEVFKNITRHLNRRGYFIGSVSLLEYRDEDGTPYHVTLRQKEWWKAKFLEGGLLISEDHPFKENLFCRGNGSKYQDFHNYKKHPEQGFLFVAQKC
jgi:Methyltransferase domain